MTLSRGLKAVFRKELGDHLSGRRFFILFALVGVTGIVSVYAAAHGLGETTGEGASNFIFLRLFTTAGNLPAFTSFVSFLGPLLGLGIAFDAINGEWASRTLSRLLAQPVHRDSVINGKFLAGITVLALVLVSLGFVVGGLGIIMTGVPPTGEELARLGVFLALTLVYVAFWLTLSLLFSVVFRQTATSALAGIASWLFLAIFTGLLAGLVADGLYPVTDESPTAVLLKNYSWRHGLSLISPSSLYDEAVVAILTPGVRTLGPVLLGQVQGAIPGAPLPLGQSLLLVWPHLTGLIAATLICFAVSYVLFMRQEIRSS